MCNCQRQKQPFPPLNTVTLRRWKGSSAAESADVNKISTKRAISKECVWLAGVKQGNARYPVVIRGKAVWTWSTFRSARKSKHWRVSVQYNMPILHPQEISIRFFLGVVICYTILNIILFTCLSVCITSLYAYLKPTDVLPLYWWKYYFPHHFSKITQCGLFEKPKLCSSRCSSDGSQY